MSKITQNVIEKKIIPLWLENTRDLLVEAIISDDKQDLIDYFITFEIECKKQRDQLLIAEVNKN